MTYPSDTRLSTVSIQQAHKGGRQSPHPGCRANPPTVPARGNVSMRVPPVYQGSKTPGDLLLVNERFPPQEALKSQTTGEHVSDRLHHRWRGPLARVPAPSGT